jgi:hypothetical protein
VIGAPGLLVAAVVALAPVGPVGPISGDSACPRPEAVTEALGAVGADWRELGARLGAGGPLATIADLGGAFRVTVAGRSRDYYDPRRACDERARTAAVVVTLMVDALAPPPEAAAPRTPPPPPPQPPLAPAAPPAERRLALEIAAVGAAGVAPGGDSMTGLRAGAAAGRGPLALVVSVGAALPHTLNLGLVQARVLRFPAAVAARLGRRAGGVELAGELGAAGALVSVQNEAPATPVRQTRPQLGAHAALLVRWAAGRRVSPVVALSADVFPAAYDFVADPVGSVGRTARVWLGGWFGLSFDLR